MKYYEIADALIGVECEESAPGFLAGFEAEPGDREPLLSVQITEQQVDTYGICCSTRLPGEHYVLTGEKSGACRLFANKSWSRARLICPKTQDLAQQELMAAAFCSRLSRVGGLLFHGSAVAYEQNGVVFIGRSGVGKTTQAELWQKHLGATILNGDKVFLRYRKKELYAFGSPWKGSSPYGLRGCAKVKAVVLLRQGAENVLEKLPPVQAAQAMISHLFYPRWDSVATQRAMDAVEKVLKDVQVYKLTCRPDRDAVMLLEKEIRL